MQRIIGKEGGAGSTYYKVLGIEGKGETTSYPSIKDGRRLHWADPEYWKHKVKVKRQAIRLVVTGNAVAAESALKDAGHDCLAVGPTTVDV